jgi:polar amino acid transport system substrate-binding protein
MLTMGWNNFKPYEYLGNNNQPTGIDLDIARNIAHDLGCTIEFKNLAWKRLVRGIEYGTIDILGSATKNIEREKWAYFSDAYTQEKMVLFVRKGESRQYPLNSINDITKLPIKIGIINGAYLGPEFDQLANAKLVVKKIERVNLSIQNVNKLLRNRIDGYIANLYTDRLFQYEQQVLEKIEVHPLQVHSTDLHFMFSKKNISEQFLKQFNQSLSKIKSNGIYQVIVDRHTLYTE